MLWSKISDKNMSMQNQYPTTNIRSALLNIEQLISCQEVVSINSNMINSVVKSHLTTQSPCHRPLSQWKPFSWKECVQYCTNCTAQASYLWLSKYCFIADWGSFTNYLNSTQANSMNGVIQIRGYSMSCVELGIWFELPVCYMNCIQITSSFNKLPFSVNDPH